MHKVLHPRDDVGRLYESRKEGGRGLTSNEDNIDASIQRLEDYIENCGGRLSHRKQYWLHEDQQNNNNQKTKTGRKATLWML